MPNQRLETREYYFETIPGKELFELVCGEYVGGGIHREVFSYLPDPTCVIKFELAQGSFANVLEWDLWSDMQHGRNAHWLAPCVKISNNGVWLIQKRTKRPPNDFKWPARVPQFMTDMKYANFGLYKGHLCAHDYANNLNANYALASKTKRHEWH